MKQVSFFIAFLFAFFSLSSAFAVKVSSLYQYQIEVDSQSDEVRAQAVREGFLQVLIKITGDPKIANNPTVQPMLRKADYYVQEYSYSAPAASPYYYLQIHFDAEDITRLLKKAGVAYWGENRPLILVWLVYTNAKHFSEIIGNENQGSILQNMKLAGNKYGLPLIFPMMDVSDVSQVSTNDIKSMSVPTLQDASKRYAADALLIGVIDQTDIGFKSQWQLMVGTNKWDWKISERMVEDVIVNALNQTSQDLAKYYVEQAARAPQWIKLEVTNITKREDLLQLIKYLKQVTAVQQVQLSQVMGDMAEVSVLVRGSVTSFLQNAAVNQHLVFKSQNDAENKLVYQWTQ